MVACDGRPSPGRATRAAGCSFVAAFVVTTGCFSEPSSVESQDTGGEATGTGAVATGSSSDSSIGPVDSTGAAETTSGGSTGSAGDGSSSTEAASSSSTGGCAALDPPVIMWAQNAELEPPMELETAALLPDTPMLARSYSGGLGSIVFDFDLPCAASIEIHALVRDPVSGIVAEDDPDSYFVSVDQGRETVWTYGCQTGALRDNTWSWLHAEGSTREQCGREKLVFELGVGPHELRLRNRESGGGLVYAAIVALVVTDDPDFDPATLYDPSG